MVSPSILILNLTELTIMVSNIFINLVLDSTLVHFCRRLRLHGLAVDITFLVHNFLERVILPALYDMWSVSMPH